ncbi:MAG: glycosyltransferase, partial [Bacteroidota bacterium]
YYKKIPCIFITHQLNVLSGNTTWFSSKMHQGIIKKFKECWVPDVKGKPNLTGKLGHLKKAKLNIKYLGPLSRFEKQPVTARYDLMILLSGPEPQRTLLEEKLLLELEQFEGKVLFVKGKIEGTQQRETRTLSKAKVEVVNFMQSKELGEAINTSGVIVSRSGYTTVMDLAKLEKKAFFIPTPGQYEQEYLAKRLEKQELVPYATQDNFSIGDLKRVQMFKGLTQFDTEIDYSSLFPVFSKVNENSEPTSSSLSK